MRQQQETHGHVIANKVPVALVGVELDGEATGVTQRLWGSRLVHNSGEPGYQGESSCQPQTGTQLSRCL